MTPWESAEIEFVTSEPQDGWAGEQRLYEIFETFWHPFELAASVGRMFSQSARPGALRAQKRCGMHNSTWMHLEQKIEIKALN